MTLCKYELKNFTMGSIRYYLQRRRNRLFAAGNVTGKIAFSDNGDGTYKMSAEHAQTPITEGYRIEGDALYTIDKELSIEEAYTRKQ